jgi:hypothetical protein
MRYRRAESGRFEQTSPIKASRCGEPGSVRGVTVGEADAGVLPVFRGQRAASKAGIGGFLPVYAESCSFCAIHTISSSQSSE